MASLIVVLWRDIPSQVIVRDGRKNAKRELSERFIRAIDAAAMRAGDTDTDAYLAGWRRGDSSPCGDDLEKAVADTVTEIDRTYDSVRLQRLVAGGGKEAAGG